MKNRLTKKYFGIAFILSLVFCITMHFPLVLGFLFGDDGGRSMGSGHGRESFDKSLAIFEFFYTFLLNFLIFTFNFYLLKPFSRNLKMKGRTISMAIFSTFLMVLFLGLLYNAIKPFVITEPTISRHHDELLFQNFFGSVLVLGSIFIIRLIYQKQTYELENEQLRSESLQSQFESLKNQMSPHFLFNTLTALKSLIRESPDLADQYVNHLAQVLRYTLQSNEKKTVTLREEIEFTDSYLFLVKMRYGTNLIISTNIQEKYLSFELPPLTIQTLLENAVKHNEISNRKPLTINILTNENIDLIVQNQIHAKLTQEEGTGIGLTNLSRQFQLLGGRDIQIIEENNEFTVIIPLIKPKIYEGDHY